MSLTRRELLTAGGAALAGAALLGPGRARADARADVVTVLHTNDTHSRLEPFENGKLAGLGGVARRAHLVRAIRAAQPHTLVLDAGDVFQGTPYYNEFGGVPEIECMNLVGYDAATIGNHEFDRGVEALDRALASAKFPILNANYDFGATPLAARVVPSTIREVGGRRVGLFGLGVSFVNLVAEKLHAGVTYRDPVAAAREQVARLRAAGADAVVLLSHLGHFGHEDEPGDTDLAKAVAGIDLIVGGHTHTFLKEPEVVVAPDGRPTAIVQVGFAGTHLGRVDLRFDGGARPVVQAAAALAVRG